MKTLNCIRNFSIAVLFLANGKNLFATKDTVVKRKVITTQEGEVSPQKLTSIIYDTIPDHYQITPLEWSEKSQTTTLSKESYSARESIIAAILGLFESVPKLDQLPDELDRYFPEFFPNFELSQSLKKNNVNSIILLKLLQDAFGDKIHTIVYNPIITKDHDGKKRSFIVGIAFEDQKGNEYINISLDASEDEASFLKRHGKELPNFKGRELISPNGKIIDANSFFKKFGNKSFACPQEKVIVTKGVRPLPGKERQLSLIGCSVANL